jgi:hypothetical protein
LFKRCLDDFKALRRLKVNVADADCFAVGVDWSSSANRDVRSNPDGSTKADNFFHRIAV